MEAQSTKFTPDIQLMSYQEAEQKRERLESELENIKQEWEITLDKVR